MAIHTEQEEQVQGFQKEIEASAMGMMLDVLQKYQYMHPQRSAIRELVSNGLDAIREKQIALEIIRGKAKEEDYFIRRDDPLYVDSNFDPTYYDRSWLWADGGLYNNTHRPELYGYEPYKVYITYEDGSETKKDRLVIEDFGTGMGRRRLEQYFNLGYSSKRNTKHALGKFGVGAKAGLAAAKFYTMTTRYNGREYSFNIYPHDIQSIVPRWNTDTGKENGIHMFQNGAKIYFRETALPNGTTVMLEPLKHHKQMYIDAVKSQLLYFDNVVLRIRNQYGGLDVVPHKATILYEDDHIILSDNTQFSKPHILISKVNYGNIDFKELELEDKMGNIGIKVAAEDVTVNPSRESLVWDEVTRNSVVGSFKKVVNIAEYIISEQMKTEDFLQWIRNCAAIKGKWSNSQDVVGRLANIVDLSNVEIAYTKDDKIRYSLNLFMGLNVRKNTLEKEREGSVVRYRIKRYNVGPSWFEPGVPIVIQRGPVSFKRDKYLLEEVYPEGFISFQVPFLTRVEKHIKEDGTEELITVQDNELTPLMREALAKYDKLTEFGLRERMRRISDLMLASEGLVDYESIEVPEDYDASEEVKDEEVEETEEAEEARKARQKLQREKGVIPIFTPRNATSSYINNKEKYSNKLWEWQKLELPVADIDKWDEEEVYYATEAKIGKDEDGKDIIEAELLHMAAAITRPLKGLIWEKNDYESGYPRYNPDLAPPDFDIEAIMPEYVKVPATGPDAAWKNTHPAYQGITPTGSKTGTYTPPSVYGTVPAEWIRMHNFFGTKVKLIKVAQDRRKFFLDFKPIQRFFLDIKGKTLTMSNALIRWNTARVINEQLWKLRFLENYSLFDNKAWTAYHNLKRYVAANYRELKDHSKDNRYYGLRDSSYDDLVNHCDKVMKFQLLVRDAKGNEALIAQAAQAMFAPQQEITDGLAIDTAFYDTYMELLEYAAPIHVLLNEVTVLTKDASISSELEAEVKSYLAGKGVQPFQRPALTSAPKPLAFPPEPDEGYQTTDYEEGDGMHSGPDVQYGPQFKGGVSI